jgi:pimeloyl-[acyl-carrier protein] methyl ester esterase
MSVKNRKTLCFLHGWGIDNRVWANFEKGFMPEWNVKTPLLPGYDGTVPRAVDMDAVAREVMSEIPEDSILIGWSLGGMIGIRVATLKPIRKLIMLAAAPCFVKKHDWPCGTENEIMESLIQRMKRDTDRALREFALLCSKGDSRPRTTYQVFTQLLKDNKAHINTLINGLDLLLKTDLRVEFSGLKCKVGVILAAHDHLLPFAAGAAMHSLRSGLELDVIKGAGHAPFISCPGQVRRSLLSMLNAGPGR